LSTPSFFQVPGIDGDPLAVPRTAAEDHEHPAIADPRQAREFYDREGYVVCRNLIPAADCAELRAAFAREIKPSTGYIYRQATASPEKHALTEHGFVRNSILNLQDLRVDRYGETRRLALGIFTGSALRSTVANILGEPGTLVQSMYFDGNPATWPHQDTYYLDSEEIGRMTAAWIALEDIHPGAGRFYVYPRSHLIDMTRNGGDFDIAFNHDRYKALVTEVIVGQRLACRAPALNAGDVLLWAAKTIHGSLPTTEPTRSRASLTAHFIPSSKGFLQWQSRLRPLRLKHINGVPVHCPKDMGRLRNRIVMTVETTFPRTFRLAKRLATKLVTHR
jgi:phytanoyl-CoA hydroxylase